MSVTRVKICPICLTLIPEDAPVDALLEFEEYPGPVYHTACVERIGLQTTKRILAEQYEALRDEVAAGNAEALADADEDDDEDTEDTTDSDDDASA